MFMLIVVGSNEMLIESTLKMLDVWPQFYLHWFDLIFWNRIVFYLSNCDSASQTAIYQSPSLSPGLGLLISEAKPKPIASPHWDQARLGLEWARLGRLRAWGPAQHITINPAVAGKPWWVQLVSFLNSYFQGCSLGLGVCEAGHHILTYSRTAVYSVSFRGGCCTNCHIEHQSHPPSLGRICNPWLCLIEAVDLQCPSASVWVCPLREVLDMPIVHHPLWEGLDWIVQMIKYWCWSDAH